jgi:hypothetical protein
MADKKQLLEIPGAALNKVKHYGPQFLKLVRNAQLRYHEIKRSVAPSGNDVVPDPNHGIVIEIPTSDEYSSCDDVFAEQASDLEEDPSNTSRYFHGQPTRAVKTPQSKESNSYVAIQLLTFSFRTQTRQYAH